MGEHIECLWLSIGGRIVAKNAGDLHLAFLKFKISLSEIWVKIEVVVNKYIEKQILFHWNDVNENVSTVAFEFFADS